jgi:hypothetical protein
MTAQFLLDRLQVHVVVKVEIVQVLRVALRYDPVRKYELAKLTFR